MYNIIDQKSRGSCIHIYQNLLPMAWMNPYFVDMKDKSILVIPTRKLLKYTHNML